MKLIKYEFNKLFCKRLFIICFFLFLAANAVVLFYTQSEAFETQVIRKNLAEYESVIDDISDLPPEQANTELKSMLKVTEIALELDMLADKTDENTVASLEGFLNQYKEQNPKEYAKALEVDLSRQVLLDRQTFLSELVQQSEYIVSYESFIGEMKQRAQHQLKFSIFAEKGSFSYNNIQQTVKDFENMNGVSPEIGNNLSIENSTAFVLTDLLVVALVFLMCIYLFSFERDKGLYALIKATQKGRFSLIASKIFVLIVCTALVCVVYYLSNVLVCGLYSGFGDMTRNIQSIEMFMNCNFRLNIWQYIILWCLSKAVTMCVAATVFALVFVLIKNTSVVYIVSAAVVIAQGLMFAGIGGKSPVSFFKYISFYYFLSGNNVFGNYLNINFFSHPINITKIYLVLMPLLFVILSTVVCVSFVKQKQTAGKGVLTKLIEKAGNKFSRINGSTSVFRCECFKHYKCSMAIFALILLAFSAYSNLKDDISIVYVSGTESAYSAYLDRLEGELTEEKESFLSEQQAYFDSLSEELHSIAADTSLSEEEKLIKTEAISSVLNTKGEAFNQVMQQTAYIKEVGSVYGITPEYINNIVYKKLVEDPTREWQYFTLLMAVIIFAASNVFAFEHKKKMSNLISCTRGGKTRLVILKISVAMLTCAISYVLIYVPYYINFINTFGKSSFDSPIIFMQDFSGVNSTITINSMITVVALMHIIFAATAVMLVLMFSQTLKNNILAVIVSSVSILCPCLMCMNLPNIRLFTVFQNGAWVWLIPALTMVCIIVIVLCYTAIFKSFTKMKITHLRRTENADS